MAVAKNTIKIRRSAVQGRVPQNNDLSLGELAINTYDGRMYFKKLVGQTENIVTLQEFKAGTGVAFNSGFIDIGQDVKTTTRPTFNGAGFTGSVGISGLTTITQGSTTGSENSLKVVGTGSGATLAVNVSDTIADGIKINSYDAALANFAKLTLSGSQIVLKTTDKTWSFSNTGIMKLPAGGDIVDSADLSVLKFPVVKRVTFDNPIVDSSGLFLTYANSTDGATNQVTVDDSSGFTVNDPIMFFYKPSELEGTFGNIVYNTTYYVRTIVDGTNITITDTANGSLDFVLTSSTLGAYLRVMSPTSYQTKRAPRQWTNYDPPEEYSQITFGDTMYDDGLGKIFVFVPDDSGNPYPLDITAAG